jgi:starvation-inducible outer membrane lipoprotein
MISSRLYKQLLATATVIPDPITGQEASTTDWSRWNATQETATSEASRRSGGVVAQSLIGASTWR